MIIITTNRGTVFINENEIRGLRYDKEQRMVFVHFGTHGYEDYADVIDVRCVTKPIDWLVEGNELSKARAAVEEMDKRMTSLYYKQRRSSETARQLNLALGTIQRYCNDHNYKDSSIRELIIDEIERCKKKCEEVIKEYKED